MQKRGVLEERGYTKSTEKNCCMWRGGGEHLITHLINEKVQLFWEITLICFLDSGWIEPTENPLLSWQWQPSYLMFIKRTHFPPPQKTSNYSFNTTAGLFIYHDKIYLVRNKYRGQTGLDAWRVYQKNSTTLKPNMTSDLSAVSHLPFMNVPFYWQTWRCTTC